MRRGRGEGGIKKLPNGRFRAWCSAGKDAAGKRVRLSHTADTRREALDWLGDRRQERKAGGLAAGARTTVAEWLDRWLSHKRPKVEPETWQWYEKRVRLHLKPTIGGLVLSKLDKLAVEGMHARLTERGASPSEQHKAATTLRAALAEAMEAGLVNRNVAKLVRKPRVERREMLCLDAAQAGRLLTAARRTRFHAFFALALDTGMRPGELFALHWADVNLEERWVRVEWTLEQIGSKVRLKRPKTGAGRRRILIARETADALQTLVDRDKAHDGDFVFADAAGGPWRRGVFRRAAFAPIRKAAKLPPIRLYDLRHTSATLLLSRDVNVRVVSERLGHAGIAITLKYYAHCLPSMQERAAATMDGFFGEWHADGRTKEGKGGASRAQEEE